MAEGGAEGDALKEELKATLKEELKATLKEELKATLKRPRRAARLGKPFGAAWLRRWSGEESGYGFVDAATPELAISLLPAHRGRGVGTLLLDRLLSAAAQRHAAVSLSVSVSNPARRSYERAGFVPLGQAEGGSITMVRRFTPRDTV
jgi:GNAT superfamily N-acetyltransferase